MNELHQIEQIDNDDTPKTVGTPPKPPLAFRIVVWILLGALATYLLYVLLVHPIDKLKLQMLVDRSYEISVLSPDKETCLANVKVDGNLIFITGQWIAPCYYEIDGRTVYQYSCKTDGTWQKTEADPSSLPFAKEQDTDGLQFSDLMKSRNYKKIPGRIHAYRLKDKIDIGELDAVELYYGEGKYEIRGCRTTEYGFTYSAAFYIVFDGFGETEITLPSKE